MPPVICNCTICSTKTIFINGVEQPGQYVDGSTRFKHEKQDKQPVSQLAKGKWQSSSPSPSPKRSRASNSPTGKCYIVIVRSRLVVIMQISTFLQYLSQRWSASLSSGSTIELVWVVLSPTNSTRTSTYYFCDSLYCQGCSFIIWTQCQASKHQTSSWCPYSISASLLRARNHSDSMLPQVLFPLFSSYSLAMSVEGIPKVTIL